jgi:P-type Ca2+ transporter type 2C
MGMAEQATIDPVAWHAVPATDVVRALEVDSSIGLPSSEATQRLERYGANRLAEAPREPRRRAFVRQFQDLLILILLLAAVVSVWSAGSGKHPSRSPRSCC